MRELNDRRGTSSVAVPSLTSANQNLESWLSENDYRFFKDWQGLTWSFVVTVSEDPEPTMKKLMTNVCIKLTASVSAQSLVEQGVLSAGADSRLIKLIGEKRIPFCMKWGTHQTESMNEVKGLIIEKIPLIKAYLKNRKPEVDEKKRQLTEKFVDHSRIFGWSSGLVQHAEVGAVASDSASS